MNENDMDEMMDGETEDNEHVTWREENKLSLERDTSEDRLNRTDAQMDTVSTEHVGSAEGHLAERLDLADLHATGAVDDGKNEIEAHAGAATHVAALEQVPGSNLEMSEAQEVIVGRDNVDLVVAGAGYENFKFQSAGNFVIENFDVTKDSLVFDSNATGIHDLPELIGSISTIVDLQNGMEVEFLNGSTITLVGIHAADLRPGMFHFN